MRLLAVRKWCMTMLRFAEENSIHDVATRKKQLRARMKERRANNENRDLKERLLIENLFTALESLQTDTEQKNVFCYLSYSSEAPTDGLIERLIDNGYVVYCPRVVGQDMQVIPYGEDFSISALRIREPIGEPFDGEIHYVIVPFLAVDKQGNRLGYGGGYYDRYFAKNPQAKRIAYGYDFQLQSQVPVEETDIKMNCIVTDKQVLFIDK